MARETVLVVEDDPNIARLLHISLAQQGYHVLLATRGEQALEICREQHVDIIVLDIRLPDISGHEVGVALRAAPQTQSIPIIVLTAFTERQDKLDTYRLVRAEHFIGKPFDIEELISVIDIHLEAARRKAQHHPVTELPTGELVNNHLRRLLITTDWRLGMIRINGFEVFTQRYGSVVGENVLKSTARILLDAVRDYGDVQDFIGQLGVGPYFVVISGPPTLRRVLDELINNFTRDIKLHYDYKDRRQGYLEVTGPENNLQRHQLMALSIAILSPDNGPFRDIRELTETGERLLKEAITASNQRMGSVIIDRV